MLQLYSTVWSGGGVNERYSYHWVKSNLIPINKYKDGAHSMLGTVLVAKDEYVRASVSKNLWFTERPEGDRR